MGSSGMRSWVGRSLVAATALLWQGSAAAQARPTTLLQDDLASNRRTKIDGQRDAADADLDAAFGGAASFSTKELDGIEDRIRAELRRDRPRASPRVIAYLYPGRIDIDRLKTLREVMVDIQLVTDPCDRAVCRDAVGKHIEIVGRAVGQASRAEPGHKLTFETLELEVSETLHDTELTVYRVPIADCIAAARQPGGGLAWLAAQDKAEQDFQPIVQKAIARHAGTRRLALDGAPRVTRTGASVSVALRIKGDRARTQQEVLDALAAAAEGLRDNPKTPADGTIEITVATGMRGPDAERRFRAPWSSVRLFLDRKLDGGTLYASYVEEVKKQKGATSMSFDDAEASGRGGGELAPPDDDQALAVLNASFSTIGACARGEASRSPSFRGVTVTMKWQPDGRATAVSTKEPALRSGALARCLQGAVGAIRLPRFAGDARDIEYPIRLK